MRFGSPRFCPLYPGRPGPTPGLLGAPGWAWPPSPAAPRPSCPRPPGCWSPPKPPSLGPQAAILTWGKGGLDSGFEHSCLVSWFTLKQGDYPNKMKTHWKIESLVLKFWHQCINGKTVTLSLVDLVKILLRLNSRKNSWVFLATEMYTYYLHAKSFPLLYCRVKWPRTVWWLIATCGYHPVVMWATIQANIRTTAGLKLPYIWHSVLL